jgi:hypothetical protein
VICSIKAKLAKKRKVTFQAGILGAEASTASGLGGNAKKLGFGTTGFALQYHKHKDFVKIPKAQKDELRTTMANARQLVKRAFRPVIRNSTV